MPAELSPEHDLLVENADTVQHLRRELATIQRQLNREIMISSALASLLKAIISPEVRADEVYHKVLEQARILTESQHGFVSSIDPKSGAHISNTLTKMRDEGCNVPSALYALPGKDPHSPFSGLWGHALNTRKSFFTNNPADHPSSIGLPPGHLSLQRFLAVPVMFGGTMLGQITLSNSARDYDEHDLAVVERLGELYAVTLMNRRREEELERLATIDYLTDLFNRRHFMVLCQREFERFQRYSQPLIVMILDIDHFKRINDTYGHQTGDSMLHGLAKTIQEQLRSVDLPCRFGGEEFAVLLPETPRVDALGVAERLRSAIADYQLRTKEGRVLSVTASLGLAEVEQSDSSVEEVINRADLALYQAKANGRNQVMACSSPPT